MHLGAIPFSLASPKKKGKKDDKERDLIQFRGMSIFTIVKFDTRWSVEFFHLHYVRAVGVEQTSCMLRKKKALLLFIPLLPCHSCGKGRWWSFSHRGLYLLSRVNDFLVFLFGFGKIWERGMVSCNSSTTSMLLEFRVFSPTYPSIGTLPEEA